MTEDNQAKLPAVGYTSYADDWAKRNLRIPSGKAKKEKKSKKVKKASQKDTHVEGDTQSSEGIEPSSRIVSPDVSDNGAHAVAESPKVVSEPTVAAPQDDKNDTANSSNDVIPISALMPKTKPTSPVGEESKAESEISASKHVLGESKQAKQQLVDKECICGSPQMELIENGSKYRCPKCKREKKNRKK